MDGKIDQTAEAEELTKLMEEEPHMERTPIFAQEGRQLGKMVTWVTRMWKLI